MDHLLAADVLLGNVASLIIHLLIWIPGFDSVTFFFFGVVLLQLDHLNFFPCPFLSFDV